MRVSSSWSATYEFACHDKSCAPPPAGSGGSSPKGSSESGLSARRGETKVQFGANSRIHFNDKWRDKEHGDVVVRGVFNVEGKKYDRIRVSKLDGSDTDIFVGSGGVKSRTARPRRDPRNTDDGYDAYRDRLIEEGVWGYGRGGRRYRNR